MRVKFESVTVFWSYKHLASKNFGGHMGLYKFQLKGSCPDWPSKYVCQIWSP